MIVSSPQSMSLSGKTFAITGTLSQPRPDIVKWITNNGGLVKPSVTKAVTHLIVSDPSIKTGKIQKAREAGTTIIGEHDLKQLVIGAEIAAEPAEPVIAPVKAVTPKPKATVQTTLTAARGPLTGKIIALTGRLSKSKDEYKVIISANGGVYSPTVTKKVTHLVAKDADAAGDKLDKARKYGIQVVDEQFVLGLPVLNVTPPSATEAAPSVLLAHKFVPRKHNPIGWWVSEKLDGVRAYWTGKEFLSRAGNAFHAPDWFTQPFPKDHCLDGELFIDRGQFRQTVSIVRSHEASDRWRDVYFMVFDIPSAEEQPFEQRLELLKRVCTDLPQCRIVGQLKFSANDNIDEMLAEIEAQGGEGLMLRQPGSKYIRDRSTTLLKVKSFKDDEAKVIGYATEGKGRLKGTTGSLQVIGRTGAKFKVGSGLTDELRQNPPPIGSIITYRYQECSDAGVPRFPTYVGLAIDKEFP